MKAIGKPNRFDVLRTVIPLLKQTRPPGNTFLDQIRELAQAIVNQNWTLFARKFNGAYQLRWGQEGLWFDDASGIAKTMFASNVKVIQFQHVPMVKMIVDFFSALSEGKILKRLEIGIVEGVEEVESAPAPIDWDAEIAKLPPQEKITWKEAYNRTKTRALVVLERADATEEELTFAIAGLQMLDIPLRMDSELRKTDGPETIRELSQLLRTRRKAMQELPSEPENS